MLTPQRGEAQHADTPPDAGTWGPPRAYAWNTAKASQRIALRGVHTPITRSPAPPPLVRTTWNAERIRVDAGSPTSHTPTDPPTLPGTLRKATSDDRLHA